jgi:hypothetical protein
MPDAMSGKSKTAIGSVAVSIAYPEPNKCSGNIKDLPDGSAPRDGKRVTGNQDIR